MPPELPVLALIAVLAIASALAVFRRTEVRDPSTGHRASHAHRRGIVTGAADILDASAGMLMLRRLLGRSTVTRAEGREERERLALAAQVEARRAGGLGTMTTPPTRLVVAGTAATHSQRDLPDRQAHPVAGKAVVPMWTSRAPVAPAGAMAAVGLVVVVVAVAGFALWPRTDGGVLSATGTPELPSPTAGLVSATPTPTESPTPTVAPTAVPTPSPTATPTAAPTATPTPSPKATQTPRPTVRPTSTPRPTSRPTATPTVTPTTAPTPTPTATAAPTPAPTATPAPTPTAEPTSTPTASPTPTPTPTATPASASP